ncbi:MAG: hypothetical protein WDZ72_12565 [Cyclobacteriaceae bacterium]
MANLPDSGQSIGRWANIILPGSFITLLRPKVFQTLLPDLLLAMEKIMSTAGKNRGQQEKEMFRLLKIFGLASLSLVLMLSFFNEHRANNSEEEDIFRITDASRIFFKNIRRAYYKVDERPEAMLDIHRLKKWGNQASDASIGLDLIINRNKNTAFLYLVPSGVIKENQILQIRWHNHSHTLIDSMIFSGGDRYAHLSAAQRLQSVLEQDYNVEVNFQNEWLSVFDVEVERAAFLTTYQDFMQLLEKY